MDLSSGLPYFLIKNGLDEEYDSLHADRRCEVLIVGAGITGALCAHACVSAGLDTVAIDRRPIGTGSTCASTALLQYEIDTPLHILSQQVGLPQAVRSYRSCAEAVEQILDLAELLGCNAQARESLKFASKRGHVAALRKEHELLVLNGFEVELLDGKELEHRFGFKRAAGLLSQLAGEIDPVEFTSALLHKVVGSGGAVYERTRMEAFERNGEGHVVRTAEGSVIHADHLILATGYESQQWLPKPVMDLDSTYAVASERSDQSTFWYKNCLIWETGQPYHYLRTTPDQRIIIGGEDEPFRNPKRRDALLARKSARLVKYFRKLFPDLPFEPEYQWCGTFGSTKDGLPYIDRDERTGAWFVLGMGGNGITFSQVGARIVVESILGKPCPDAGLFKFDR